ncbi:unnamed protein product [Closterium sp. Yama58-4]|nr:unnamed protein product [Closterium sp. Yama58-4]
MRGRGVRVGVVARYGSAVGEFGRALVPLMEVAGHLEGSLGLQASTAQLGQQQRGEEWQVKQEGRVQQGGEQKREQGGEQRRRGDEGVVLFFPGDDSIRSHWTVHAARLLFGESTRVEAGRVAGQKFFLAESGTACRAESKGKFIHPLFLPPCTSPGGFLEPSAPYQHDTPPILSTFAATSPLPIPRFHSPLIVPPGQKQQGIGAKWRGRADGKNEAAEQENVRTEEEKILGGEEGKEEKGKEEEGKEEEDPVADAEAMARQEVDDYADQYQEQTFESTQKSPHYVDQYVEQHSDTHAHALDSDIDSHRRRLPTDTNFPTTPNPALTSLASAGAGASGTEASPPASTGALRLVVPTQQLLYLLPDRDESGRLTGSTGKGSWQVTVVERDNVEGLKNQQEVVALIQEVFPELSVAIVRLGNMSLYDQVTIMKRTLVLVAVHDLILSTSLFFLPRGAVLVELFPYKLFSTQHKKLALRSGIHYMAWQNQFRYNAFFMENCFWRGGYKDTKDERVFGEPWSVISEHVDDKSYSAKNDENALFGRALMRAPMCAAAALAFRGVAIAALLLSATCVSTAHGHSFLPRFRSARALTTVEVEPSPSPESHSELRRALNAVKVESIAGPRCVNAFPAKPLCKFVDSLASRAIPVLDGGSGKTLSIGVYQTYQKFHRDLPATKIYAYGTNEKTASYPGPTIVAKKGVTTRVTWCNRLQDRQHMFKQDYTLMKEMPKPKQGGVPTVPHHHGGETMSMYDGHPLAWFTQFGEHGPTFASSSSSHSSHSPNSSYSSSYSSSSSPSSSSPSSSSSSACVTYEYRNQQPASLTWYHDHTLAWTRLNTVAGMAGFYIKTDPNGDERDMKKWLPPWKRTVPLAIADRLFFKNGSINFPNVGVDPKVHPNWIPEYIGDTIVVNGVVWPYLRVRPAVYRFLLLGAANARFFNLRFQCAARGDYPNFVPPLRGNVINFALIGSDGGYLQRPVFHSSLLLAPGERYDILVDFAAAQQGGACRDVILTNDAAAPFPGGEAVDRNTGVVMRFVILDRPPFKAPAIPRRLVPVPSIDFSKIHRVRWKKLVETINPNSGMPERATIDGLRYMDPVTEIPVQGTNEIWHIINLSADAHPIHLHLVQFRVVSRRAFDIKSYQANKCSFTSKNKPSCYVGPEMKAQKHEIGWKDTVPALPGQVLTFWVGWYGQDGKPFEFDPTSGPGYVWHCHILDHEDNDMMRPLKIRKQ